MIKTGIYTFTGFKPNGTKAIFNIYEYDIYDIKLVKKFESLQKKIISIVSNPKKFTSWSCDYTSIDVNIVGKRGDKM